MQGMNDKAIDLIWALWSDDQMREGGGRQQSNPWRPGLPFYIAIDLYTETQQGIDFHTNKSRKTPLLPLGPNTAAPRWTDWEKLGKRKHT